MAEYRPFVVRKQESRRLQKLPEQLANTPATPAPDIISGYPGSGRVTAFRSSFRFSLSLAVAAAVAVALALALASALTLSWALGLASALG